MDWTIHKNQENWYPMQIKSVTLDIAVPPQMALQVTNHVL